MSDNTTLPSGSGGDTIRTIDKTGTGLPKTEVVALDLGGGDGRSESILNFPVPASLPDVPVDDDGNPMFSLSPSTMDALEMLFRQTMTAVATPPYPITAGEILAGVMPVNYSYPSMMVDRYGTNTTPGTTDMLPAILAAIAVTAKTGGGTVDFLPGTYFHSAEIPMVKYVRLRGASQIGTLLLSTHTGNGIVSAWSVNGSVAVYEQIENLTIKNTNASNTGAGFVDVGGTYIRLARTKVQGFKFGAILDQTELADIAWCDFQFNLTGGIWLTNGPDHTPGLTFTAGLAANATSGTLNATWTGFTGTYTIAFVETVGGATELRTATLTNGITAAAWNVPLAAACNATTTAANALFTNRIAIYATAFNQAVGTGTAILDDGGNALTIQDCNFSGFGNQLRSAGRANLNLIGGLWSLGNAACLNFPTTTWNLGGNVGKSYAVSMEGVQFGPASGQAAINISGGLGQTRIKGCFFSTTVTPIVNAGAITSLDADGNALATPTLGLVDALPSNGVITGAGQVLTADAALAGFTEVFGRQLKVVPIASQTTAFLGGGAAVFGGDVVVNRGTGSNYLEVCNATKNVVLGADSGTPFVGTMSNFDLAIRTNSAAIATFRVGGALQLPTSALVAATTQVQTGLAAFLSPDVTYTSNAALANIAGLSITFNELGKYAIELWLAFWEATSSTGGFQFDFNGGAATIGTILAASDGFGTAILGSAAITSISTATSFATIATATAAPSWALVKGYIQVTGTGTFIPRGAQNTSSANTTTLKTGSYLKAVKIG